MTDLKLDSEQDRATVEGCARSEVKSQAMVDSVRDDEINGRSFPKRGPKMTCDLSEALQNH